MLKFRPILAALGLIAALRPGGLSLAAEPNSVLTPRGAPIHVVVQAPDGRGPFPAVVLAPGTGSLRQTINDAVADALQKEGFAVYRFEWAYYVRGKSGAPSDTERGPEIEDLTTVVAMAKADPRVDPSKILIGGKSRGSIIAWRVLRNDPSLKGALQLTPVCTKAGFTPDQLYPDIEKEPRPSLWLTGDVDPACKRSHLYRFVASASGAARIAILRGDHGLGFGKTPALAASLAVDFAEASVSAVR